MKQIFLPKLKDNPPLVMAILNLNRYSQTPIGRCSVRDEALRYADKILSQGAAILDIGAEPTNPSIQEPATLQQELDIIMPVLEALKNFTLPISIDTSQPKVMEESVKAGASMINDVRALRVEGAIELVARLNIPVCLMHMQYPFGKLEPKPENSSEGGVISIFNFLKVRADYCVQSGISREKIVIDPGFGHGSFGKNLYQNLQLLKKLNFFKELGYPLLVGVSRKTFIGELLNLPIEDRLAGSIAATTIAVMHGANIIRTHDVKETVEAIKLAWAVLQVEN